MNYRRASWMITAVTALARLAVIGRIGLSGDEAHYWTYTQHPSLSYFDHPPLIAWIIRISTLIFGDTCFAVRLPAVLLFAATSLVLFRLARDLYDEKTAFWTIVLVNLLPVFSFLGAVLTVPDAPLALCWVLFAYLFHRITAEGKGSILQWVSAGAVLGCAFLSKYNAALLPVSAGLYLLFSPRHRPLLRTRGPYIALATALVMFTPVIIWNMENAWVSFGFQLHHGFGAAMPHLSLPLLGRSLGAQAGYLSPLFFILFWWVLFATRRSAFFVFAFSAPTLVLFNAIASFNEILPHWPAMGYLLLTIPVARFCVDRWHVSWFRSAVVASTTLAVLLTVLVPLQALFKLVPPEWFLSKADAQKVEDGIVRAEKVDITNELYGWEQVGRKIDELLAAYPADARPFVFSHRHFVASQLGFAIPSHPRVYSLSDRIDAYDLWQRDLSSLDGRDALFVTNDYFFLDPATVFPFARFDPPLTVEIRRNGRLCRLFWITRCHGFSLAKLPPAFTAAPLGDELNLRAALVRVDRTLFCFFNQTVRTRPMDFVMRWVSWVDVSLGVNTGLLILMTIVAAVLWRTRRGTFWMELLLAAAIVAVGGLLVNFMKDWFGRMRPPAVFGPQVCSFAEIFYKGSFPSGHTQIAFGIATYLTTRLKKYWWIFFACAAAVGFSRMYIGVHYPSDVLAGAAVGSAVALIMTKCIKP